MSSLEPVKWYHKMSICKTIGVFCASSGLLLGGSSLLFSEITDDTPGKKYGAIFTGIVSGAVGIWLLKKKYMNDPEALYEYYLWFLDHDLFESIQEYGWSDMVKFASGADIQEKILFEINEQKGFDIIYKTYGQTNVQQMLNFNVFQKIDFENRFNFDNKTMTSVPVIERVDKYGLWLTENTNLKSTYILDLMLNCPLTTAMTIQQLNSFNLQSLCLNHLIDWNFVKDKVIEAMNMGLITFRFIKFEVGKWIVDNGIVPMDCITLLFRETVLNSEDCSDILADFWDWPLGKYGLQTGIESNELGKLESLNKKYVRAKGIYDVSVQKANQAFNSGKAAANAKRENDKRQIELSFNREKTNVKELSSNKEERKRAALTGVDTEYNAKITELNSDKEYKIHIAETTFDTTKGDINHEWNEFKRGVDYRQGGNNGGQQQVINVTVVNQSPPQQQYVPPNQGYPVQGQNQGYPVQGHNAYPDPSAPYVQSS